MKTAIIYSSTHGTTKKVARLIAEKQNGKEVSLIDLGMNPQPVIDTFDRIIIGGSIHVGMIQKRVKRFCEENIVLLLQKETGMSICCMRKDKQKEQFDNAFLESLRAHSKVHGYFGGEFLFEKMNCLEKLMVKKVAKVYKSISQINYAAIDQFVSVLEAASAEKGYGETATAG